MSHFTKIKTKLYDRVTIEKSLSDLNIEWESEGTKIRGYNNQEHSADICKCGCLKYTKPP